MRNVFSITEIFIMVHGHGHGKGKKQSWEGVEMQIVMYNVHMTDHASPDIASFPRHITKPLLGGQNRVTKAGGRHNLVPGGHMLLRGPALSFICTPNLKFPK